MHWTRQSSGQSSLFQKSLDSGLQFSIAFTTWKKKTVRRRCQISIFTLGLWSCKYTQAVVNYFHVAEMEQRSHSAWLSLVRVYTKAWHYGQRSSKDNLVWRANKNFFLTDRCFLCLRFMQTLSRSWNYSRDNKLLTEIKNLFHY